MDNYNFIYPAEQGKLQVIINSLYMRLGDYIDKERSEGRAPVAAKVFMSDPVNQEEEFRSSLLYKELLSTMPMSVVGQSPVNGSKIAVLIKTTDSPVDFHFDSLRLTADEAQGKNSYEQTVMLFDKYLKLCAERGLSMKANCTRTWIYVKDIDNNYSGVVKARNDVFRQCDLTPQTHFIASTGIGGVSGVSNALVAIDFLSYPNISESDMRYLTAPDHLNPTQEYGVAFERGTRLDLLPSTAMCYISGTASINNEGKVLYKGDVVRQTGRLLENISMLLLNGEMTMKQVKYFLIYLRDFSDALTVEMFMRAAYPDTPFIILHAPVCRPEWLIEMECVAE
jgi:enamine deaminase RidA (YjgF/YER057c/UK114 family)